MPYRKDGPITPNLKLRKPTNARTCACGETVFAYTSLFCIAIVDVEDGHLLDDYKWNAAGKSLESVFYANSNRYRRETGNSARLHLAVMGHPNRQQDHINHNGHDCRKANLRSCTNVENIWNSKTPYDGSSKYKGVTFRSASKWLARITVDGKLLHLGIFGFEPDAAICYNYHAAYYFGDFAKLNRVPIEEYMHD